MESTSQYPLNLIIFVNLCFNETWHLMDFYWLRYVLICTYCTVYTDLNVFACVLALKHTFQGSDFQILISNSYTICAHLNQMLS